MIARRTQLLIKENLVWAVLYNVVVIPLAARMVTPIVATIGMLASSMIVVGNSLRILRYQPNLMKRLIEGCNTHSFPHSFAHTVSITASIFK